MSKKVKKTETEIDEIVISEADDEMAWGDPVQVRGASRAVLGNKLENPMHQVALLEIRRQREILRELGIDNRRLSELADQQRLIKSLGLDYWKTDFARIAAESIASLNNVAHSPFFEATRDANLALVHLMKNFQEREPYVASQFSQLSHAWHQELNWIKEIESLAIGKAISEHLAQISEISVLAHSAMSYLAQEQIADIFKISSDEKNALSASIASFSSSYRDFFASFENNMLSVLALPPQLSRLPAVEFFNAADLLQATSSKSSIRHAGDHDEKLIVREEISRETTDALEVLLVTLDPKLITLRSGAQQALVSDNPDRVRHFVTSYRELFTHVLHDLAPDQEVRAWSAAPEHYSNARPTRKARLLYISRKVSNPTFTPFLEKDIEVLLAALQLFQKGTHEVTAGFSLEQLKALQIRIEAALRFMLEVSRSDNEGE